MLILAPATRSIALLNKWLAFKGCPEYANLYAQAGTEYGVMWDMALFQSCLETGFWRFGGDVNRSQDNFAGLGATGNGAPGDSFSSPLEGIKAHMQNLALRAGNHIPREQIISAYTRKWYDVIAGRNTRNWEELSGTYATDPHYHEKIFAIAKQFDDWATTGGEMPFPKVVGVAFNETDSGRECITLHSYKGPICNFYPESFLDLQTIMEHCDANTSLMIEDKSRDIIPIGIPEYPNWVESAPRKRLAGKKFAALPGHSLNNPGAHGLGPVATRPEEWQHNVLQAQVVADLLRAQGASVITDDPANDNLTAEGERAAGCIAAIFFHHNAANRDQSDEGSEVFYLTGASAEVKHGAQVLSEAIAKKINARNRGAKPANYTVLVEANKAGCKFAFLTESYFIDDYSDRRVTESRSKLAAIAIAETLIATFGR